MFCYWDWKTSQTEIGTDLGAQREIRCSVTGVKKLHEEKIVCFVNWVWKSKLWFAHLVLVQIRKFKKALILPTSVCLTKGYHLSSQPWFIMNCHDHIRIGEVGEVNRSPFVIVMYCFAYLLCTSCNLRVIKSRMCRSGYAMLQVLSLVLQLLMRYKFTMSLAWWSSSRRRIQI